MEGDGGGQPHRADEWTKGRAHDIREREKRRETTKMEGVSRTRAGRRVPAAHAPGAVEPP